MVKVSYGITVCNELEEITKLINFLHPRVMEDDEILVQYDEDSVTEDVLNYLRIIDELHTNVKIIGFPLNKNFADFKNNLKNYASGLFIVQLDADELPSEELIANMHDLLDANKDIDLFFVPRINTVDGLTIAHLKKWGWKTSKLESQIGEKEIDTNSGEYKLLKKLGYIIDKSDDSIKYYKPIINHPDVQTRIYRRTSEIEWDGKVHERIKGYNTMTFLPFEEAYSIYHPKSIDKQEKQNELYSKL